MDAASDPPPSGPAKPAAPPPPAPDALDLKGKLDRFGDLLTKTLDLAEIGMNLSLSLMSTVGAVAQQKIAQRLGDAAEPAGSPTAPQAAPAAMPGAPEPPAYGITNRLALRPGGPVSISFSVNNESASTPKQVSLAIEGFAGDRSGRFLPADMLRVVPQAQMIQPMDFEKFVLEGTVPAEAAPDTYRGAVVVASDDIIRIPVWLVIAADAHGA